MIQEAKLSLEYELVHIQRSGAIITYFNTAEVLAQINPESSNHCSTPSWPISGSESLQASPVRGGPFHRERFLTACVRRSYRPLRKLLSCAMVKAAYSLFLYSFPLPIDKWIVDVVQRWHETKFLSSKFPFKCANICPSITRFVLGSDTK
jgi:hypothetical protein